MRRLLAGPVARWLVTACLAALCLALGACGDDDAAGGSGRERFVALDGSPRVPDDAGVVTAVDADFETLTLDGEQVYEIHPEAQSFASIDGSTLPLRARLGQYVHVGLDGDTVLWVATIGSVLRLDDEPETVTYLATVVDADDEGHLMLRDGTVFVLDESVGLGWGGSDPEAPMAPFAAVLRISVADDTVVAVEPAS